MLHVDDSAVERLAEARAFAKEMGLGEQLSEVLSYLENYGHGGVEPPPPLSEHRFRVVLYKDWAPHSFGVAWYCRKDEGGFEESCWMNGGLIYHGPPSPMEEDKNLRVQNLSVTLDPSLGWKVHT
jgi:hypothetical protein